MTKRIARARRCKAAVHRRPRARRSGLAWALFFGVLVGAAACGSLVAPGGTQGADAGTADGVVFVPPDGAAAEQVGPPPPDAGPRPDAARPDAVAPPDARAEAAEPDALPDTEPDAAPPPDAVVAPDAGPPPPDAVPADAPDPACDPATGHGCPCTADGDCAPYDDADLCNGALGCRSGRCALAPETVVACPPADACGAPYCNPATGECERVPLAEDGTPCEDGDLCSEGDVCGGGLCRPGPGGCDDGNPCTDDTCVAGGCSSTPNAAPCDDGDPCTGGDRCGGGNCQPGTEDLCATPACVPVQDLYCEGTYGVNTSSSQATDVLDVYPCAPGSYPAKEIAYSFRPPTAQLVEFVLTGGGVFRLFVLSATGECNAAACLASATDVVVRRLEAGEEVYLVIDGASVGTSGLRIRCHSQTAEQCGNELDDDWDDLVDCADPDCAAEPACIPVVCPDGICHPSAEDCASCEADCGPCSVCPDGACTPGYETCSSCPADCGDCPTCGDGACSGAETCTSCPADCGDCPLPCANEDITCGQVDHQSSMSGEDASVSGYDCGSYAGNGNDHIYRFVAPRSGTVNVLLNIRSTAGDCDDYDLYVLEEQCLGSACIDYSAGGDCDDSASFSAVAGRAYAFVVESYSGTGSAYDVSVSCP